MSRRRRAWAPAVLACALAASTVPARAEGSSSPAPEQPLPTVAQLRQDVRDAGCLQPSTRTTGRTPWAQALLPPDGAWVLTRGGGVTVAVVGSGVDGSSPALAGRLTVGPRESGGGDAGRDCVGHGTLIAGLIAGRRPAGGSGTGQDAAGQDAAAPGASGQGPAGQGPAGLAPEAGILAVAVTDDTGATSADLLAKGIRDAVDGGARVVAVAVTVPGPSDQLTAAVRHAQERGVLLVAPCAADADGARSGPVFPASYPGVLAVADIGPNGAPPNGAARTGRIDLAAPGDAVAGAGPGGGHFSASGPSYAAAYVAGAAALVLARRPGLTLPQLVHRLEATAYRPGSVLPDPLLGHGTVDPVAAVTAELPEEQGAAPAAAPAEPARSLLVRPPVDPGAVRLALLVAGGAGAVVLLLAFAATLRGLGRRGPWRPGA
ncbi:S8 family serine peptidase [Kitasatospora sp. NPDC094015]|uniref:S8 family serine peptidase n=1 Tax=Kitasatospora sp. NPDC094015 TaxID=3155205 RepID=UPI00332B7961